MNQNEAVKEVIFEMTKAAGMPESFAEDFYNRIVENDEILEEFITYLSTQKFICKTKICGYSVVDVLVWQMDHFKAFLDRGDEIIRYNECEMILKAFDTFMKLKDNPEKYVRMMSEESGSDYDGKF